MAESKDGDKPAKKGKGKLLIIGAIVGVLLLGGGGAAAFFMTKGKAADHAEADEEEHDEAPKKAAKKKKKKKAEGAPVFVTLDPFTVNLADEGSDRFAQVALVLQVEDEKAAEEIKKQMPAVRNGILLLLSSKSAKELLTLDGKKALAEEIAKVTADKGGDVEVGEVNFSQFIVQ